MKKTLGLVALVAVATVGSFTFANDHGDHKRGGEHHEEVKAAIEANDYSLLPEKAQEKMTEEQFAQKVAHYEDMEEHKAAVEEAVANNNFAAFESLHEAKRSDMEAKRQERIDAGEEVKEPRGDRKDMTDEEKEEKLKEKFDDMLVYYNEHGELPEMKKKEKKGMKRGRHFGATHKGIVKNVIRNANPDRLEAALEKIASKVAKIEANESIDDDKKEMILDLLAGIQETIEEILAA